MKKLFVLAAAGLMASSAYAGEMKWSGSANWRYDYRKTNDSMNSVNAGGFGLSEAITKAHRTRANLGVTGGWDSIEYGAGIRTNSGVANNDYITVDENTDQAIALEQAWFRYVRDFSMVDLSVTIGRQKNVFAYESTSQNFFDNDVRFDGFGWNFKLGSFGLNAAQYILGARSSGTGGSASAYTKTPATEGVATTRSNFEALYGFQPYMNWKFTDEIDTMLAVGWYSWVSNSGNPGAAGTTAGGNSNINGGFDANATNTNASTYYHQMHSPKQWQFLNTWNLPYNLAFSAELVINKKTIYDEADTLSPPRTQNEAKKSAWVLGLTYGKVKKAHDFSVSYHYGEKGLGSVINQYSFDRFLADQKGHTVNAHYAFADNFNVGVKYMSLAEQDLKNQAGAALVAGVTGSQDQRQKYWELNAGVAF